MRAYKAAKRHKYRSKMSANKKRAIRQKDAKYKANRKLTLALEKERVKEKKAEKRIAKAREVEASKSSIAKADKICKLIESATPTTSKCLNHRDIHKATTRRSIVTSLKSLVGSAKNIVINEIRNNSGINKDGISSALGIRMATFSYKP